MSSSMSPRSILKRSSAAAPQPSCVPPPNPLATALPYPPEHPQVHFPPSPALTQTHYTHSVTAYDRAPIVVLPNDCALPERGCPGRTYECSTANALRKAKHPRAMEEMATSGGWKPSGAYPSASASSSYSRAPPPLVPDVSSSESDESDGVVSPPPEYYSSHPGVSIQQYPYAHGPITAPSQAQLDKALAFLPYGPAAPPIKDHAKRDKEKKRRSGSGGPSSSSSHPSARYKSDDSTRSFAASSLDGCLGGF